MILDEAHRVVTKLSAEMQGRINPSAVIEFTATPHLKNNTLYNVYASELKDEEMIKLPIALTEHNNWEMAVTEAIAKRAELEKAAQYEREYVRPVLLFQAQNVNSEITVEKRNAPGKRRKRNRRTKRCAAVSGCRFRPAAGPASGQCANERPRDIASRGLSPFINVRYG